MSYRQSNLRSEKVRWLLNFYKPAVPEGDYIKLHELVHEYGEFELALESLCSILEQQSIPSAPETVEKILALSADWGIFEEAIEYDRNHLPQDAGVNKIEDLSDSEIDELVRRDFSLLLRVTNPWIYDKAYRAIKVKVYELSTDLLAQLEIEGDQRVRGRVLDLLGDLDDGSLLPIFELEFAKNDPETRVWCLRGLERIASPKAKSLAAEFKLKHPRYNNRNLG